MSMLSDEHELHQATAVFALSDDVRLLFFDDRDVHPYKKRRVYAASPIAGGERLLVLTDTDRGRTLMVAEGNRAVEELVSLDPFTLIPYALAASETGERLVFWIEPGPENRQGTTSHLLVADSDGEKVDPVFRIDLAE